MSNELVWTKRKGRNGKTEHVSNHKYVIWPLIGSSCKWYLFGRETEYRNRFITLGGAKFAAQKDYEKSLDISQ
jgi:hypothetical protein